MNPIAMKVREAGVVGAGGAGFPAHIKLNAQAEIVIVNGAECEPLLKTDQQLAARYPEEIIRGLSLAMEATGAQRGIIALKAKYIQGIQNIKPLLRDNMEIVILPDVYPAGDEVMTIWFATGRRVPPGGLPLQIGVVVHNIQSIINIAAAVNNQAVTHRTLTVTGLVHQPLTLKVPIGTRFTDVLNWAGGISSSDTAVIEGGPVMGKVLKDLSEPVTKTTVGLIVLPEGHPLIQAKQQSLSSILRIAKTVCEQCQMCTDLCPRHLIGHGISPHLLIRSVNYNTIGDPQSLTSALICSECGVCEVYACPVGISPRQVNIALKKQLRLKGVKYAGAIHKEDPLAEFRLVPTARLIQRLGLKPYYREASLSLQDYEPAEVLIKLQQHIGAPAVPVVQAGAEVVRGQLIAEIPENALGARVHASISGRVWEVNPEFIRISKGGVAS